MVPYGRIALMADTGQPDPPEAAGPFRGRARTSLSPAALLIAGVALLLLAMVVFGGSRVLAAGQRHAYDSRATPPATYRLTAGKDYQLSAPGGVAALTKAGLLVTGETVNCTSTDSAGVQRPLIIQSTKDDDRDLTEVATFQTDSTGTMHISCAGISKVFVDDADNAAADIAGSLMLLTIVLGVLGVLAAASGGYALSNERAASSERVRSELSSIQMPEGPVDGS
jgi:hypothetical protein